MGKPKPVTGMHSGGTYKTTSFWDCGSHFRQSLTMEKNHEFFSAKLKQFIPFIILMALHGISHGYPINQVGQLRALWGAHRQSQGPNVDDMWTVPSLKSGVCSKVGKMEDDLITEGGLPGQPSLYSWSNFKQYAGKEGPAYRCLIAMCHFGQHGTDLVLRFPEAVFEDRANRLFPLKLCSGQNGGLTSAHALTTRTNAW
ncbi:hypothetical protein Acr_06g0015520 [Actinidia rufa]|uniref:Uncharacterized protein n=1 Tax=Actinidia rufa TaxID=165716 RepID=A0A7J0ETD1_9ERIC|nr:hypothetical protein Acr_06g0015520 [Actinidia rufa]